MESNSSVDKSGDLIMLLDALKTEKKVFSPTSFDNKFEKDKEIQLYETLVLYQDREDSLYFRDNVIRYKCRIKYLNSTQLIETNLF